MTDVPGHLESDPYTTTESSLRKLSFEENLNRQLDRIAYLRSTGKPWAEAVYQLRDSLVGFEDPQFYDGIPPEVRAKLDGLAEEEEELIRAAYKEKGWNTHSVRAFPGPNGEPLYRPTPEDLSVALRILMGLLDRMNMLRGSRSVTRVKPRTQNLNP